MGDFKDTRRKEEEHGGEVSGINKKEMVVKIVEGVMEAFKDSDLGTPKEEMERTLGMVLKSLPENGKIRKRVERHRGRIEMAGELLTTITSFQDGMWQRMKPLLMTLVPDLKLKAVVAVIPDDINEKTMSAVIRFAGVADSTLIEVVQSVVKSGGSKEDIAEIVRKAEKKKESMVVGDEIGKVLD